jgi:MYXO-CTERM domain-containing protein
MGVERLRPVREESMKNSVFIGTAIALASMIASCSAPVPQEPLDDDPSAIKGELAIYIATFDDGTSETRYFLRDAAGAERALKFSAPPDVAPGSRVSLRGVETKDGFEVTDLHLVTSADEHAGGLGTVSSALIGVEAAAPRKFCVAMVDIGGGLGKLTEDAIAQQFFDGPKSVNAFFKENSYGKQSVEGKVFGPYSYTFNGCAGSDTSAMATAIRNQMGETCDQYAFVFGQTKLCSWAGLGEIGSPTKPARNTWYNGTISCVATVQEPGHNYGMVHSSSMSCGATTFADDLSNCTHNEYGDKFDTMGSGCRQMNVYQKQYEQWFAGCNSVRVTSSGTFNLLPTEIACDGIQALQIKMPKDRVFNTPAGVGGAGAYTLTSYFLEYRTSYGFDDGMTPTVLLHVAGDYPAKGKAGLRPWLLDMHPGGTAGVNDAGFKVGETFTDPAGGLSITVQSMDADKAVINVQIDNGEGDPTCLDGTTLDPPTGPIKCVGGDDAGAPVMDAAPEAAADAADAHEAVPEAAPVEPDAGREEAPVDSGTTVTSTTTPLVRQRPDISDVEGGCSCRMSERDGDTSRGAWVGAALLAWAVARRRNRPTIG